MAAGGGRSGRSRPRFKEEWLVAVLDSLSEGVVAIDGDGRLTAANPAAEVLLGFDVSQHRFEPWSSLAFAELEDADGRPLDPHPIERALQEDEPSTVTAYADVPTGGRWLLLATHILDPVAGAGSGVVVSFHDITPRVRAQQDREQVLAVLRDVLAMTSHDLRGPITTIAGYTGLLESRAETDEELATSLAAIRRQTDHLGRLVGDLSVAARLESGALATDPVELTVHDVVTEALQGTGVADVVVDVPDDLRVVADEDHTRRIVANLLENAAKYGSPPVTVAATRDDSTVRLTVSDAGPGVPEAFVPALFDRFTRAVSGARDGSGLGLAIVAGLTALNGGSVRYEPCEPCGARFVVELPDARSRVSDRGGASVPAQDDTGGGT